MLLMRIELGGGRRGSRGRKLLLAEIGVVVLIYEPSDTAAHASNHYRCQLICVIPTPPTPQKNTGRQVV